MSGQPESGGRQKARAGRDVNIAGRDQIVAGQVVITVAGTAEPVMPGLLPRDVTAFTGREDELNRLIALAESGRVVVSAIGGTAGVGKTALAVHVAHQLLDRFPDGHLYADLRGYTEGQGPAEPGGVLEVFLRRLGVPAEEVPVTTEERSGLLRQVLAPRRVLMVLDNARFEGQVRPLLPGAGGSLVLVTSRSALPGLDADERISLDVLPEVEAVAMLARVIGAGRASAEPGAVRELAGLCERLPLALRIAGQMLGAHPAWPVARLAGMLAGERDRLARLCAGDLQVRAAFGVSFGLLEQGDARVFRLLGLHPGPDFTVAAAAALAEVGAEEAGGVLGRLAGAYLVTEDVAGRFGMHDLLRLFARGTCHEADSQADREAAEARLVGYYADLAEFLDSCVDPRLRPAAEQAAERDGGTLPSMREALAAFQAERPCLLAALSLAAQRGWDEQVRRLSDHVGVSLTVLRYLDDMLIVAQAMLAAIRRTGDRVAEGLALINLGGAYGELRRFEEAVDCFQGSLVLLRETSHRYGEGQALQNLAIVYGQLRRIEEAVDCFQQSLVISRETGDRYSEGQALNNLGKSYRELRQFEKAIDCYQQAMALKRETGDRRGEGLTLNGLGLVYGESRRFEEAVDYFQRSLAICRETGDRRGEGAALNNLGGVYGELRRFKEAVDCFQQDVAICREIGDRYGEGQTLAGLARTYQAMRQRDRAAMCWREAAAAMRDLGDHKEAGRLEQLAASAQPRRRWWRRGNRPAGI